MHNPTHKEFTEMLERMYPRSWVHWEENDIYYDHNPLSVLQNKQINRMALAVSPAKDIGDWAVQNKIDVVLVHHPYGSTDPVPSYALHTRADRGLRNTITGEAVGINELWARYLGLKKIRQVDDLYAVGEFPEAITFEEADRRVSAVVQRSLDALGDDYEYTTCAGQQFTTGGLIKTVNICSGAGGIPLGNGTDHSPDKPVGHPDYCDLYVTGEIFGKVSKRTQKFNHILECTHTLNERLILVWWKTMFKHIYPGMEIIPVPFELDWWSGQPKLNKKIKKTLDTKVVV